MRTSVRILAIPRVLLPGCGEHIDLTPYRSFC
jgi:hypothetical protein